MKLDSIDRQLLAELDSNARISIVELASRVRSTPETARYRLKRLEESGLIRKYLLVLNREALGLTLHRVFLKLKNTNSASFKKITDYLSAQHAIPWVAKLYGRHDLAFSIHAHTAADAAVILDSFIRAFYKHVDRRQLSVHVDIEYLSRGYLQPKSKRQVQSRTRESSYDVDTNDRMILEQLSINARMTAAEIARTIGVLSVHAVLDRIKRLEEGGIIQRYTIDLAPELIGYIHFKVLLFLNYVSGRKLKAFLDSCRDNPELYLLIKSFGEWDYELDIESTNITSVRDFMMALSSKHPDVLRDYQTLMIEEVYKYRALER